jgi:hypothetical protein
MIVTHFDTEVESLLCLIFMSVLHNKEIQETSLTSLYVTASESNSATCTFECIFNRAEKLLLVPAVWVRSSYFVYRPIQISFS